METDLPRHHNGQDHHKVRKAISVLLRRLQEKPGLYDIEACWTIGVLASALDIADNELADLHIAPECLVSFVSHGDRKIQAVRAVRSHTEIGIKEGIDLVEGQTPIRVSKAKARAIQAECQAISFGCIVKIAELPQPRERPKGLSSE